MDSWMTSIGDGLASAVNRFGDGSWMEELTGRGAHEFFPDFLHLDLIELPAVPFAHRGDYGRSGDWMPPRFRWVHLDFYAALMELERAYPGCFYWTDVRRSPAESLVAVQTKKGALRPGYSVHGFGGAGDLEVERTRRALLEFGVAAMGMTGWKLELDAILARAGLYCLRTDGKMRSENWHFQLGGHGFAAGQRWIEANYAAWWMSYMSTFHVQRSLAKLGLYDGDIDGILGRLSRTAIRMFQATYGLRAWGRYKVKRGHADARTRRVLSFVTAVVHD